MKERLGEILLESFFAIKGGCRILILGNDKKNIFRYVRKKMYLCIAKRRNIIIKYTKMKKVISSLLMIVAAFGINSAKADNLSMEEAREAAAYFMNYYNKVEKWTAQDLELVYQVNNEKLGVPASYFFNLAGEGWIIMAATTVIDPIIGYSIDGTLDMDCMPDNMRWWLEGYSEMVSEIQQNDAENNYPDDPMWTALSTKSYKGDTKDAQHILMNEKWGQGDDLRPTYNYYCPRTINSGRYAIAGCVATALSQIIHYYQFPRKGTGTASYNLRNAIGYDDSMSTMPVGRLYYNFDDSARFRYSNMPDAPTNRYGEQLPSCSDEQMHEIARLMYAAGVAVKMAYLPDHSGALSQDVPAAAANYFKYKMGRMMNRTDNNGDAFVDAIREQLLQNNIVYMSGRSSTGSGRDAAGHAWVCGGYMETDTNRYFMNWGWDGGSNNFFNLRINSMSAGGYNFNRNQSCIIGMVPPDDSNRFLGIVEADLGTQLGKPYPNPAVQTISLPYKTESAGEVVIYNIEGRRVGTYRVQAGEGELQVHVGAMPAGVYIYRLNSQSGKFMVR